jgi:hypothetical protein
MPPVSPSLRRCFAPGVIRVDDALCGAARCRGIALCQRGIGAFKVIVGHAPPGRLAGRSDRPGHTSGREPTALPKSPPSSKLPKPECAFKISLAANARRRMNTPKPAPAPPSSPRKRGTSTHQRQRLLDPPSSQTKCNTFRWRCCHGAELRTTFPGRSMRDCPAFCRWQLGPANRGSSGSLAINDLSGAEPQRRCEGGLQTQLRPAADPGTTLEGLTPGARGELASRRHGAACKRLVARADRRPA